MSGQDQQYTPTLGEARGRYSDGAIRQGISGDHLDAFDRLIAQVRRDAAREALTKAAEVFDNWGEEHTAESIRFYRDRNYPEVTP